jgi:hypothetical protein
LWNITDLGTAVPLSGRGEADQAVVIHLVKNRFQKSAFACSVGADQGNKLPTVYMKINVMQNFFRADLYRQILHTKAAGITAAASMKKQFHFIASRTVSML